jgi:hypothetical protein
MEDRHCLVTTDIGASVTITRPDITAGLPDRKPSRLYGWKAPVEAVNSLVRPSSRLPTEAQTGLGARQVDALSRRPYPKACTHCPKVEQQSECWKAQITATAAMDSWNHSSLRREQLCENNVGPILQEVEAGECPKWKNITDSSPTYKSYWFSGSPSWSEMACWSGTGSQPTNITRQPKQIYPGARRRNSESFIADLRETI